MALDPAATRLGRLGCALCALGSLTVTLAAAFALLSLRIPVLMFLPAEVVPTLTAMLNDTAATSVWFVAFNLLPLPPLTGAHFIGAALPGLAKPLMKVRLYAGLALGALVLLGAAAPLVRPLRDALVLVLPPP